MNGLREGGYIQVLDLDVLLTPNQCIEPRLCFRQQGLVLGFYKQDGRKAASRAPRSCL